MFLHLVLKYPTVLIMQNTMGRRLNFIFVSFYYFYRTVIVQAGFHLSQVCQAPFIYIKSYYKIDILAILEIIILKH